ncbi:Ankyrin repeat protein 2 [Giardia muris]|uniref:Ankyrin repeat protein 2 n=1 Tax=Giardia muris TaxID=5742 RepID=A0A4Z1T901_GIAMU|nr:Ankyrin repeat protein 2 [Giardia muris]|eukprot:TNJ29617.1 Ankyrin repeat protein 2 [Giardia muris]
MLPILRKYLHVLDEGVRRGDSKTVRPKVTDVGKKHRSNWTPLMCAARGSTDIVALLEPYELGLRDSQGNTAGHIARALPRNSKEVAALLERDSPDNLALRLLPPAVDITPLIQAVIAGDREAFHAHLDEAGRKDTDGRTALMYAAERGEVEFVRLLRTQELRMQDQEGRTALMLAAQHGEVGCVKLLLEEADLENSRGESALDIAESVGSKASHHTRCQCCARILRDDAGAGVGVGRHLSVAQRKLLTMQELSTAFSGDDAQHVENAFSNIIAEPNFLRQLTEQQDRKTNAAEIASLQRRLDEKDAEVTAERQEHGRRIAELTAHLQERTDELERNLTTSLKTITTSRAVLQSSSCIVCPTNPKDTLLQPCGHLCVCSSCAERIMSQTCPFCRTPIESVIKAYI